MKYTKFQRFLSFVVLFFFLFSTTIHFPLPNMNVFASESGEKNIVSIIVEEETYKEISGEVGQYANNISTSLGNTQVIILPTPVNTPAYEIASLNESLYNQGLEAFGKGTGGKLIGTVLIGKIDVPIVYEGTSSQKSIVPYIDFADKYFTYNHQTRRFEKNENNLTGLGAEIWHGVINPNMSDDPLDDVEKLKEYFSKNNDFYQGSNEFSKDKILLNGKQSDELDDDYKPYVFYFDQLREFQGINYENFQAYEVYQKYKEDIVYKKYTQELAEKIQEELLSSHEDTVDKLGEIFGSDFSREQLLSSADIDNAVPDIQSRHIINKTTKKFIEIFSKGSIGQLRKNVYNAGRYNYPENQVHADFIPYLITLLDAVNEEIIKETVYELENEIDKKVLADLQKTIAIPFRVEIEREKYGKKYTDVYVNLLAGEYAKNITSTDACGIFTSTSEDGTYNVMNSRGGDMSNIEPDIEFLQSIDKSMGNDNQTCTSGANDPNILMNIFGGHTPLNIDSDNIDQGIKLKNYNHQKSLIPVYSSVGGLKSNGLGGETNYQTCLEANFFDFTIHSEPEDIFSDEKVEYQLPALGQLPEENQFDCSVSPRKSLSIDTDYDTVKSTYSCSASSGSNGPGEIICTQGDTKIFYNEIYSIDTNKYPTNEILKDQIGYGISPKLPVHYDRYVSFKNKDNQYEEIIYPNFFDFPFQEENASDESESENYSFQQVDEKLQEYLSENIENFGDIDFYEYLQSKEEKTLIVGEDEKTLRYYDALVFAIYWSNLNSVSAKYQFVLENYLGDEFQGVDEETEEQENYYHLPKNKKEYEIVYMGAKGDGSKMHIQMNPESKGENPYADIIEKNASLQSQLLGKNIGAKSNNNDEALFKCAPPEGVPIFEWIPAVVCWLDDMLPPTISVSESTCGTTIPLLSQEQQNFIAQCNGDEDKNGVNDCLEKSLNGGSVDITTDVSRYYINTGGNLTAQLLDSSGNQIVYNNSSEVNFKLTKVEIAADEEKEFIGNNIKTIYTGGPITNEVKKYISFTPTKIRVNKGKAQSAFTARNYEANYYFQAEVTLKNDRNAVEVSKNSEIIKVEIRDDKLFAGISNLTQKGDNEEIIIESSPDGIQVNNTSQLFIIDSGRNNINDIKNIVYSENDTENKAIISLEQKNKGGVKRDIQYPLNLTLFDGLGKEIFSEQIKYGDLQNFYTLPAITQAGSNTLEILDNNGQKLEIELFFTPGPASQIDTKLGANILESGGSITTNVITVLDRFGNPLVGERLTVDTKIKGSAFGFQTTRDNFLSNNIVEGYQILRLKSGNTTGVGVLEISVKNDLGKEILNDSVQIRVVNEIPIQVSQPELKVGGDTYNIEINIGNSAQFENFNSRLYFTISDIYGSTSQPYFEVKNGKATVELQTTTLASESVPIEIQVEGLNKIYKQDIEVLHGEPKYLQMGASGNGIQANGESTEIKVFIKDEFGNIAYSLDSGSVGMEVPEDYKKFLTPSNGSIEGGIANLEPETTEIPGMAYFKVSYGGMEAAGKLETYFHWDGDSITNGEYNGLYTTLLGAPYGDVTQRDYLAKSLLFNEDNRALTVTSLLNSPYKFSDVLTVEHNGAIRNVSNPNDLSTDIVLSPELEGGNFVVNVRNVSMGDYVSKVIPKFGNNTELFLCNGNTGDFTYCLDDNTTSILLQSDSSEYKGYKDSNELYIQNIYGEKVFSIDNKGNIEKNPGVYFEIIDDGQKYLQVNIMKDGQKIGAFVYNFINSQVLSTRTGDLVNHSKFTDAENTIFIQVTGGMYAARNEYGEGNYNKVIYYNDPFDVDYSLNKLNDGNINGYENFVKQGGNGWFEGNKALLQFAAGETVGSSVKPFQSFSVVNLGDPVLRLKKIRRELPKSDGELRDFDGTIGKLLSNEENLEAYQIFDYNNDKKKDIVIIRRDKYLEILENNGNSKEFLFNRGNIGNIYDLGNPEHVGAGDFSGDGFGDIFFIADDGEPFLFNNIEGKFTRGSLLRQLGMLDGAQQVEIFDMDDDGIDDIVILKKGGGVAIYYGGSSESEKVLSLYHDGKIDYDPTKIEISIGIIENQFVVTPKYKGTEVDVGNIYPYFGGATFLQECKNFSTCDFGINSTVSIGEIGDEFELINTVDELSIAYQGNDIFSVQADGSFSSSYQVSLKELKIQNKNVFGFEIFFNDIYVGKGAYKLSNAQVKHDRIYEVIQSNSSNDSYIIDGDTAYEILPINRGLSDLIYNDDLPIFDVRNLGSVTLPDITNGTRSDNGALFYSGMPGADENGDLTTFIEESEEFMDAIQQNVEELHEKEGEKLNTSGLYNLIYTPVAYKGETTAGGGQGNMLNAINNDGVDDGGARGELEELIDNRGVYLAYPEAVNEMGQSNFIRSEYAKALGVDVLKNYGGSLYGDTINFSATISNESGNSLGGFAYVERIIGPFQLDTSSVSVSNPDAQISFNTPGYDFMVSGITLNDGETLTISAKLNVPPITMGHIDVGYFEADVDGVTNDRFGDIIYRPTNQNCSQGAQAFYSCEQVSLGSPQVNDCKEFNIDRFYSRPQERLPECDAEKIELPDGIGDITDSDGNGVPDYIDELSNNPEALENFAKNANDEINLDSDNDGIPDSEDMTDSSKDLLSNLDEINENIDEVIVGVDSIVQGLSCGFGGGGCIATPLNWAPLAPGGDPTLFGAPIGDGLRIDEGLPVFSAITWMPYGPVCGPSVWPISPLSEGCSGTGAGGYLGVDSPSNFFRLYVTPTLTGGMGVAACFGGPARVAGYSNMPGLHPLMPGGNCIVTAMPLSSCSNNGSDGDPSSVGFNQATGGSTGVYNANCNKKSSQALELSEELVEAFMEYKQTGEKPDNFESLFKESFTKLSKPNSLQEADPFNKPLVEFNNQGLDDELSVSIDFSQVKSGNFEDIIQVKNRRISAFPDFLMGWVTRQIEEIVTKLTDFPTVFIILPDFSGVLDFGDSEASDRNDVIRADNNLTQLVGSGAVQTANSGIKEAYTFLSNIPLVQLQQENLAIEIPWISGTEVEATKAKWGATLEQWKAELDRAKNAWSFGTACSEDTPEKQKECEDKNAISEKYIVETQNLIASLEQNLQVLESYKDLPKDIGKLVRKKEDYLEQILCNVESISEILGGWIGKNGERFKAWVELYILIKAVLKSWQLLVDVFVDFEAECHECKNERGDLMTFIWKLISAVIPDIPVIQFPKWPDIIIDLHNIRAGLTITLPEFSFGTRPIVLPNLPNLYLPDVPNVSINLPELPVLPEITLPELPDLPGLPTVELPNLPPPPTLPKMFAQLEGILEILKAITKAMCILKTSPFVPEWRAGDQIAFLTERQGYLPMDFLDLSLPQFSFPFVDAIEVTTYVNLEFETDFITELARQVTMPLTTFSNDFTQVLNLGVNDLDFRYIPQQIDVNIGANTDFENSKSIMNFVSYVAGSIGQGVQYLDEGKDITVSNTEFKQIVAQSLGSKAFSSHPKYNEFREVWDHVFEYNFEKENEFIAKLEKNNFEKFETLENILHTEIMKNKQVEENLDEYLKPKFIQNVSQELSSDVDSYNQELEKFNERFYDSVRNMTDNSPDPMAVDLQERGEKLQDKINTPLQAYREAQVNNNIYTNSDASGGGEMATTQCYDQSQSEYRYEYKGLYGVQTVGKEVYSYNLIDYKDELDGKENLLTVDMDDDGDKDFVFLMRGQIYMKENLSTQKDMKNDHQTLVISSRSNKFYNSDTFYGTVENFREGSIDSNIINAKFTASTQSDIYNYRMTLNEKVDRSGGKNSFVDAFSNIEEQTYNTENELFSSYDNLAYLKNLGYLKYLELRTKEMINIRNDIKDGNTVSLSQGTKLYAGNSTFRIGFITKESNEVQYIVVRKNSHIELNQTIKVIEVSGDAYIQGRYDITLKGEQIRDYRGLPIFSGTHATYVGNGIVPPRGNSYIEVEYFDSTQALINFNFIQDYWLYDLGAKTKDHAITINVENDYKYAYIQSFKKSIFSTRSNQIVLSPQLEADSQAPIFYLSELKIPIYQTRIVDLTDLVYEDSGLAGIDDIRIDMDLEESREQRDIPNYKIIHTDEQLRVVFGPYEELITRDILFEFTDVNGNISQYEVPFEVYAPNPEITQVNEGVIQGNINEDLSDQPVSLFRYRNGTVSKLEGNQGQQYAWTDVGNYDFELMDTTSGLEILYGSDVIAFVDEQTGKINKTDLSTQVKVFASNHPQKDNYYPRIELLKNNRVVYYQHLKMKNSTIGVFGNFELDKNSDNMQLVIRDSGNYGYQKIPNTVNYNPGSVFIYSTDDNSKKPLFVLFPDGRIQTANSNYTLQYSTFENYITLELVSGSNIIAEVLYKIDGGFSIQ